MPATASRSPSVQFNRWELAWVGLATICVGAMLAWPTWETVPFHLIWFGLALLYGFRTWSTRATVGVLSVLVFTACVTLLADDFDGVRLWDRLLEVPLLVAIFVAMAWHARRRVHSLELVEALADDRAALLAQQERLLQNVSHELRTPVTIARGHLELLERDVGPGRPELAVAFDELRRIEQIVDRLLLLSRAERDDFLELGYIQLVPFLEDTFIRWVEVAPRAWRLGDIVDVAVLADETWLRAALDALLENAVHYTDEYARIELSARGELDAVVICVDDHGHGVPAEAAALIFERFARADPSRTRREGGAGLGLAIVDAIARAHGGSVTFQPRRVGSRFELRLPLEQAINADNEQAAGAADDALPVLEAG
jgi:signal transduction histidine kinase